MALFKIYRGLEANLPTEMHDGYAYFCSDSAAFFIDFLDYDGNLQRKQLNAKDAETLSGASLATILQSSEVEIPTSKAVFDALKSKQNKLTFDEAPTADSTNPVTSGGVYAARSDWNQNDETAPDYVKNRTHYIISPEKTIFEWDGNIEGLESIEGTLSSYKIICYKMSDDTSWAVQEPVNATRFDKIGSEEGYLESEITPVYMDDILEYSVYTSALYVVFAESYTISKYNVTLSKGTWVLVIDEASIGGISRISKLSTIPVYQKIPNHYLPAPTINAGTGKNAEVFNGIAAENASGDYSHTEGQGTTASASCAHSEGDRTVASGNCSHAEGSGSDATGTCSHAEGQSTTASGIASHTEGICVEASGNYSHAEGYYTTANSKSQHTQGEYNVVDTENKNSRGTYSHVVGNGTSDTKRSNAHTLDWSGNAWFAGDVYVGSTSGTNKDEGSVKLMKEVAGTQGQVIGFDADGNAIAENGAYVFIGGTQDFNNLAISTGAAESTFSEFLNSSTDRLYSNTAMTLTTNNAALYLPFTRINVSGSNNTNMTLYFAGSYDDYNVEVSLTFSATDCTYVSSTISRTQKQPKLTGTSGQMVGFDSSGNAIAQDMPSSIPSVTTSDNGKFLRVVDGAWAATTVQSAEEVSF